MKIIVTGAYGQLGWELLQQGTERGFEIIPADLPEIDICSEDHIRELARRESPQLMINAAAYTNVDQAESDEKAAFAVNRDGPGVLARQCQTAQIPLIHVSTDFVFDGLKNEPYLESDPVNPIGVYGRSKAAGEAEVQAHLDAHIIVRTAWLYGVKGHNFVKTMLRLARERKTLGVVADQYGCPTSAFDLAEALLTIAQHIRDGAEMAYGVYHYCGQGVTTWFDFTQTIVELAQGYGPINTRQVQPITTADYPTPARRPPYSALDCGKIQQAFGVRNKPWRESLKITIDRIFSERPV